jgi:hypothetical protein
VENFSAESQRSAGESLPRPSEFARCTFLIRRLSETRKTSWWLRMGFRCSVKTPFQPSNAAYSNKHEIVRKIQRNIRQVRSNTVLLILVAQLRIRNVCMSLYVHTHMYVIGIIYIRVFYQSTLPMWCTRAISVIVSPSARFNSH